jgi:phage terminase small subunit
MGRHYDTDDVHEFDGQATRRLRPPPRLRDRAKAIFIETVTGCDPKHFRSSDQHLLERYCEATALAEEAAVKLAEEGRVVDGTISPWFFVHQSATKTASGLALRLRLGPQSRAPRAPKTEPVVAPSFYDRLELEGDDDDEAGEGRH